MALSQRHTFLHVTVKCDLRVTTERQGGRETLREEETERRTELG